jgi:hypothetical protein
MDVENPARKFLYHALVVNHLQDEVRRVRIQSKVIIRDDLPHLVPDGWRAGKVIPSGLLVIEESELHFYLLYALSP